MQRYFISIQAFCVFLVVLLLACVVAGCGGGSGDGSTTDQAPSSTGSASSAALTKKVDELCVTTKSQFEREYAALLKASKGVSLGSEGETLTELVNVALIPTYERLISQINALEASGGGGTETASFVAAVEEDLAQASKQPSRAFKGGTPFPHATKVAKSSGLAGCADSMG